MNKTFLSLNFMYCMERFAAQIYRTQTGAFKDRETVQKIMEASDNEKWHVERLREEINNLNGNVYPFGCLFQFMGIVLGYITRISGQRNLFKTDSFVEKRAVKDYTTFLKRLILVLTPLT